MSKEGFSEMANLALIDELFAAYSQDPESVDPTWRAFFAGWEFAKALPAAGGGAEYDAVRVASLIDAFRTYGHLLAMDNPLEDHTREEIHELSLSRFGFTQQDLSRSMPTNGFLPEPQAPLSQIYEGLKKTYCGAIGIEFKGFGNSQLEEWIEKRIEPFFPVQLSVEEKKRILTDLFRAELMETFIHTKYVGQKRFSLEGAETLIPMLEAMIDSASDQGVKQTLLGMAHRGRLNVLANVLGKSYAHIFHEFEDHYSPQTGEGTGDVKYHKGYFDEVKTLSGHTMGVTLVANPSHLESVDPVLLGSARAMQMLGSHQPKEILPVLIHGDASVAGQGVVYETIQLSGLRGYGTGGSIHIVINNQIGFTTVPRDSRSTRYCTDIGKAFGAPIFHVNAENPEECVHAMKMAFDIRQQFGCDVFIDLLCYRKYGHNEGDEPTFTQPLEYKLIRSKKSILTLYREALLSQGVLSAGDIEAEEKRFREEFQKASVEAAAPTAELFSKESKESESSPEPKTAVSAQKLITMGEELVGNIPKDFEAHPKVLKQLQGHIESLKKGKEEKTLDWAISETLAYASLLADGVHIRISGQDVRRGTFSHRHAMLVDQKREGKFFPLSHLKEAKALFDIYNSPLSEFAVLGFEYGYTLVYRNALVIWEAQYGDFSNGAQVVIDQYLSSSQQKWGESSGLTLFLPHGYEGQGPEHSSARMERYLQLAADDNMRIADLTSPAQLFHLLRRQGLWKEKKPLILFTPKAILRHPMNVSALKEFEEGSFQPVLDDPLSVERPRKLLFCSGKVFFDLYAEREKRNLQKEIAIIRIEQLYPFPQEALKKLLKKYSPLPTCIWVQEEPANMGAYTFINLQLPQLLGVPLAYAGRAASASTAAGTQALHKKQYAAFIQAALEK